MPAGGDQGIGAFRAAVAGSHTHREWAEHRLARPSLAAVGCALLVLGALPLVPGMVRGGLTLGVFVADPLLDAVRLALGVAGVAAALAPDFVWARRFGLAAGLWFALLALAGGVGGGLLFGLARASGADTSLHAILCVLCLAVWELTDAGMETRWLTWQHRV